MLGRLLTAIRSWFRHEPAKLAIVRRYTDANGSFIGELYAYEEGKNFNGYTMIGASLDTLPYGLSSDTGAADELDLDHDFLAPMPPMTFRVGALNPSDNDAVRRMVGKLAKHGIVLTIQNRFCEYVLEKTA